MESVQRVARIVKDEEHRYATTFQVAEKMFQDEIKSAQNGVLPGAAAFRLYDTFGLALDEQEEMAREFGLAIDMGGFHSEMNSQKTRARASWKGADQSKQGIYLFAKDLTFSDQNAFVGYEDEAIVEGPRLTLSTIIDKVILDKTTVTLSPIEAGYSAEVVLRKSPFYPESGGQIGDIGALLDPASGRKIAEVTQHPSTNYRHDCV